MTDFQKKERKKKSNQASREVTVATFLFKLPRSLASFKGRPAADSKVSRGQLYLTGVIYSHYAYLFQGIYRGASHHGISDSKQKLLWGTH